MTALDRLAERLGIEASFKDAFRRIVHTAPETKRALLAAMDVPAPDEAAAARRLAELEREEAARPLPPVLVVAGNGSAVEVPLNMPEAAGAVRWQVEQEDSRTARGRAVLADLPQVDAVDGGGRRMRRRALRLPLPLPSHGYHRVILGGEDSGNSAEMALIVAPEQCYLPPTLARGRRIWGIAAQLYLLRSAGNWGIGDFTDLARLIELAATLGADAIGLNPLHALSVHRPEDASPYSPSSRLFLNVLYIDVTAVAEFAGCAKAQELVQARRFQQELAAARAAELVDYGAVTRLKLPVLEALYQHFRGTASPERRAGFAAFRRERDEELRRFAIFEALADHFAAQGIGASWRQWPAAYHDPASPAVKRFAEAHEERVAFHAWLQWLADRQLAAAAETAARHGMALGLYLDLAVGADAGGAEAWAGQGVVRPTVHVGAPPDVFNPAGQDWGLPPFDPRALSAGGYACFAALLRANMRHAGALRIDHVMGLQRLYWIPEDHTAAAGAYVGYPLDDLVRVLALESQRHRCLVIGEDLGTVPPGFRARMRRADILSYRVLYFEQDDESGRFGPAERYPPLALATIGNHDMPTLRGWWEGRDIAAREELDLYPEAGEAARQYARRKRDRARLAEALAEAGLHPASPPAVMTWPLSEAVHAFLARAPSMLALAQLDDLVDEREQVNLPGTSTEYPNWRRRMSVSLEALPDHPHVRAVAGLLRRARSTLR